MKVYTKTTTTYYISKCHHCGKELSRNTGFQYGNALVRCPNCGQYTIDNTIWEMAMRPWQFFLDNQKPKENKVVKYLIFGWMPVVFIVLGISGLLKKLQDNSILFIILPIILYVVGIVVYRSKMTSGFEITPQFEQKYKESERRLADPQYRQLYKALQRRT